MWDNIVDLWKSSALVKVIALAIVAAVLVEVVSMVNQGAPPARTTTPASAMQQMLQKASPVAIPSSVTNAIPPASPQLVQQAQNTGQALMTSASKGAQTAGAAFDAAGDLIKAGKNATDHFLNNQQQTPAGQQGPAQPPAAQQQSAPNSPP